MEIKTTKEIRDLPITAYTKLAPEEFKQWIAVEDMIDELDYIEINNPSTNDFRKLIKDLIVKLTKNKKSKGVEEK